MATQPYFNKAGVRLPGVTTILGGFKDPGALQYWAWQQGKAGIDYKKSMEKAASVGTIAHAKVEAFIRGKAFDASPYPPDLVEKAEIPFRAFHEWAEGSKFKAVQSELPLISERYQFGGCLDAMLVNGRLSLGDWKTSKAIYPEYWAQVAAYGILWEENFPEQPIEGGYHILRFSKEEGEFDHSWLASDNRRLLAARQMFLNHRDSYRQLRIIEGKEAA